LPSDRGLIVRWSEPPALAGANRHVLRAAGRVASRAALAEAIAAWRAAFGEAEWQHAPVEHDEAGAPRFACAGAPALALAHTAGLGGAAIAAPGVRWAGIDAEPVAAPGARALRQLAEQSGEAALAWGDALWPLRLWCAKEAVVKAERVPADILGRSLRVESVAAAAADGTQRVTVRSHLGRTFDVSTVVVGAHVRAETA
jgi:4'-phosphopantetheinyl transferase EntD